jgi:hypothetical protein
MISQDSFPDVWDCDSADKRVVVELRVPVPADDDTIAQQILDRIEERFDLDIGEFQASEPSERLDEALSELPEGVAEEVDTTVPVYEWIEIPTTKVEQWVEKGDAAQIQRTAKVTFPTEWGDDTADVRHASPRKLIEESGDVGVNPFIFARIWWQNQNGDWILGHFGWVGGIGSASTDGASKLWVYDFAELISGVPVGVTFSNASRRNAAERIAGLTNSNTPAPISELFIFPPRTEEEFAIADIRLRDQSSDFITRLSNAEVDTDKLLSDPASGVRGAAYFTMESLDGPDRPILDPNSTDVVPREQVNAYDSRILYQDEAADSPSEFRSGVANPVTAGIAVKSFKSNHDTLLDVWRWYEEKSDAKLHFEPLADSVALVSDIVPERRTWTQKEVAEASVERGEPLFDYLPNFDAEDAYEGHDTVSVIRNNALYEIKPLNTLQLRGSAPSGIINDTKNKIKQGADNILKGSYQPKGKRYPVVKAQAPALVEAAEGVELSGEVVESNTSSQAKAEQEARRKLADRLEEASEGEIVLGGSPRVMPFDAIDAFEVCSGEVTYEQQPVRYEVESIKHEVSVDDPFTSTAKVSVWANDDTIEIVESRMVEVS